MKLWDKAGNISEIGNTLHILLRYTDYCVELIGREPIKISEKRHHVRPQRERVNYR
jgi:hypothetical protein